MCDVVEQWGVGIVSTIPCKEGCAVGVYEQGGEGLADHWPSNRLCMCNYCAPKNTNPNTIRRRTVNEIDRFRTQNENRLRKQVEVKPGKKAKESSPKPEVYHPTLLEIADRAQEIEAWDAARRPERVDMIVNLAVMAGMLAGLAAAWSLFVSAPTVIPAVLLGLWAVLCVSAIIYEKKGPKREGERPAPIALVPFTEQENKALLINQQEPEPFRAVCACPGCGNIEAHTIREPRSLEPKWAAVIRRCGVCQREWAHG